MALSNPLAASVSPPLHPCSLPTLTHVAQVDVVQDVFVHQVEMDGQMHGPVKMESGGGGRAGVRRKSMLPYDPATVKALSDFQGHSLAN